MRAPLLPCVMLWALASAAYAQDAPGVPDAPGAAAPAEQAGTELAAAVFATLDKVTAQTGTLEAVIDVPARFGVLELVVRACHKRPPEEPPRTTAFVQITETRPQGRPRPVFSGWMFASSPALNALEHPVYDVWLTDCKTRAGESSSLKE